MLRYEFVPFHEANELLSIATTHPIPPSMLTDLEQKCGKKIKVFLGEDDAVMKALHAMRPTKDRKLRRQRRIKLSVPVAVRFYNRQLGVQSTTNIYTGKMIDVSETGFMISMAADLRKRGACVQLSFALPPQTVEAICSIRYIKEQHGENKEEQPFVIGLQIMDMSHDHRLQLKEVCVRASMWNMKDSKAK
jgi:hypothetical protein